MIYAPVLVYFTKHSAGVATRCVFFFEEIRERGDGGATEDALTQTFVLCAERSISNAIRHREGEGNNCCFCIIVN